MVTVRSITQDDFDQWLQLWQGYNVFYERVGPAAIPEEVTQMTWARFFDAYEPMHCRVAEEDGRLLGLVHFIFHRNTTMLSSTCYLQDLFTVEAARGKGVGTALVDAVYDEAKAAGAARVYWHTHETNKVAQGLYDRIADRSGFIVYRKDL